MTPAQPVAPPEDRQQTPSPAERRAEPRHRCQRFLMVRVLARPSFHCHRAVVHDVTANSLGLVLAHAYEAGTVLAVQVQRKYAGFSNILTARVRHATQLNDGNWLLGCSLCRNLSHEEVAGLR
jgi:hypothetical protein